MADQACNDKNVFISIWLLDRVALSNIGNLNNHHHASMTVLVRQSNIVYDTLCRLNVPDL